MQYWTCMEPGGFVSLRRIHGLCLQFLCVINSKHLIKQTDTTVFTICDYPKRKLFTLVPFRRVGVQLQWGIAQWHLSYRSDEL